MKTTHYPPPSGWLVVLGGAGIWSLQELDGCRELSYCGSLKQELHTPF